MFDYYRMRQDYESAMEELEELRLIFLQRKNSARRRGDRDAERRADTALFQIADEEDELLGSVNDISAVITKTGGHWPKSRVPSGGRRIA